MAPADIRAALKAHPFLEGLPEKHIDTLAAMAFEASFEARQIIFRESDPSSFFYLILSGTVALEITTPGRLFRIQTIGEGEELGWSSLLAKVNKQFQARSLEPVRAFAFDGARLRGTCDENPEFGYLISRKVLEVVAERLSATRLQLLDVYANKGGD